MSMVREIKIGFPTDVLLAMSISEEQLAKEMRHFLAFKFFSEGRLSSGKAAKLAGMSRISFLLECGQRNIDILPYSEDELRRELAE